MQICLVYVPEEKSHFSSSKYKIEYKEIEA